MATFEEDGTVSQTPWEKHVLDLEQLHLADEQSVRNMQKRLNEYGCTPEQYHGRLDMLWKALGNPKMNDKDVFERIVERLADAERVIDEYANKDNWWIHDEYDRDGYVLGTVFDFRGSPLALSYRAKYPKEGK